MWASVVRFGVRVEKPGSVGVAGDFPFGESRTAQNLLNTEKQIHVSRLMMSFVEARPAAGQTPFSQPITLLRALDAAAARPVGIPQHDASGLTSVTPADWRIFAILCEAFLTQDDPYLEAAQLGDLAEQHDWNERTLFARLENFARLGWLRLVRRSAGGRAGFGGGGRVGGEGIKLIELTFAGLDVCCRAGRVDYPALVREVASCLVYARPDTGLRLRSALLSAGARIARLVPDLLLAHAVEALAKVGLLECCGQWGGSLGFQIGRVAPELRRWVESCADDTPALAAAA